MLSRISGVIAAAGFGAFLLAFLIVEWAIPSKQILSSEPRTAPASNSHPGNPPKESWVIRAIDDPLTIFTLMLVFVGSAQVVLFYVQLRLIRYSLDAAEIAANAAKDAAQALPRVERAYVFLGQEIKRKTVDYEGGSRLEIRFAFKNHGKTPAILRDLVVKLELLGGYPESVGAATDKEEYPPGLVIGGGELTPYLPHEGSFTDDQWLSVRMKHKLLLFYGVIKYDDVFGKPHETGFCVEWGAHSPGFTPSPTKTLNYHT